MAVVVPMSLLVLLCNWLNSCSSSALISAGSHVTLTHAECLGPPGLHYD